MSSERILRLRNKDCKQNGPIIGRMLRVAECKQLERKPMANHRWHFVEFHRGWFTTVFAFQFSTSHLLCPADWSNSCESCGQKLCPLSAARSEQNLAPPIGLWNHRQCACQASELFNWPSNFWIIEENLIKDHKADNFIDIPFSCT